MHVCVSCARACMSVMYRECMWTQISQCSRTTMHDEEETNTKTWHTHTHTHTHTHASNNINTNKNTPTTKTLAANKSTNYKPNNIQNGMKKLAIFVQSHRNITSIPHVSFIRQSVGLIAEYRLGAPAWGEAPHTKKWWLSNARTDERACAFTCVEWVCPRKNSKYFKILKNADHLQSNS